MNLLDQLKRDESLRLTPYRDSVGKLTIGYGHNLDAKGISLAIADEILHEDAIQAAQDLARELPWTNDLDEARRAVLINMCFNMGIGCHSLASGLLGFNRTLQLIEDGKYSDASAAMLQSKWARQVGARATRLARQMETGEWQ